MFSNLTTAGSICSDRKAGKGPKSSYQATILLQDLVILQGFASRYSNP